MNNRDALSNDDIDRIWTEVEWRDLCPVMPGFEVTLRNRFARAIEEAVKGE